jgi:hypothetical protein
MSLGHRLHARVEVERKAGRDFGEAFDSVCKAYRIREYLYRQRLLCACLTGKLECTTGSQKRITSLHAAWTDLEVLLKKIEKEYSLTGGEEQMMISGLLADDAKWLIRLERHPEDPSHPGGLE